MLIALIIAACVDMKKREIPLWVFPLLSAMFVVIRFESIALSNVLGAVIAAAAFAVLAVFFHGGGGDMIMMTTVGFILGIEVLSYIILIASILCLIYSAIKKTEKNIPYAPFVLCGYLVTGGTLYGGSFNFRDVVWHYVFL